MNNIELNLGPVTDTELLVFLSDLNAKRKAVLCASCPETIGNEQSPLSYDNKELLACEIGPKYIRVSVTESVGVSSYPHWAREVTTSAGKVRRVPRCAYCFIDRETGNILKPKDAKQPLKHSIRGNIRAPYWETVLTPYGVQSLR